MLSNRQSQILKIIVEKYIKTGLPIGSKTILENNNNINFSSATIRNECVELETLGLLEKHIALVAVFLQQKVIAIMLII